MKITDTPLTGEHTEGTDIPTMDEWRTGREADTVYSDMLDQGFENEQEYLEAMFAGKSEEEIKALIDGNELGGTENGPGENQPTPPPQSHEEQTREEGSQNEGQQQEQAFKPINFQTNIDGKAYNFNINNQADLNAVLDKAALSEDLWEKKKELDSRVEELSQYEEIAEKHLERMEKDPVGLAGELLEEHMFSHAGPDGLMDWAARVYHHAKSLKENPASYEQAKTAHLKKSEVDPEIDRQRKELEEQRQQFKIEQETSKLESWKMRTTDKYAQVADAIGKMTGDTMWFNNIINTVMENGLSQVRQGKNFGPHDLDAKIRQLILPTYNFYQKTLKQPQVNTPNPKNTQPRKEFQGGASRGGQTKSGLEGMSEEKLMDWAARSMLT